MMPNKLSAPLALAVVFLAAACAPVPGYSSDLKQTLTPLSENVRSTVTARALEAASGGDTLATAVFDATQQADWIYATQTARAGLYEPARLATATAIAPVVAELPRYGIDPGDGYVAWLHNPVTLELNGYQQSAHASDYPLITAADFVVATDITWNTQSGVGSCGFLFRSDGVADKPSQYMMTVERVANGRIAFGAAAKGEISNYNQFYPKENDPTFDWSNDVTNRFALVVRGNLIDIYTNGNWIAQLDITHEPPPASSPPPDSQPQPATSEEEIRQQEEQRSQNEKAAQLASEKAAEARRNFFKNHPFFYDGFLAFLAANDTGSATCRFENAWLFILEK
jgi:hypothetical protein